MSAELPTLGVVMPTRNQAKLIDASVHSVLVQPEVRRLVV
jgi:glycosyltransferase involved in cell wall biosynthesis